MFRSISLLVTVLAVAMVASACNNSSTTSAPTTTPTTITETWTGTLVVNGSVTYPFTVQQTGTITATIASLAPDSTVTVGLLLGTWNGTSCAASSSIVTDAAVLNTTVTGNATGTGNFCARIYDTGHLAAPTDFVVTVSHY